MIDEGQFNENLRIVRESIARACEKCGRQTHEVKLLPVTKNWPVVAVEYCRNAGMKTVGENRVQEAREKQQGIGGIDWELIGHLQGNKVNQVVGNFSRIQTVDSLKLLRRIAVVSDRMNLKCRVLLQVNTGKDPAKFGFSEREAVDALGEALQLPSLLVEGLMTIAPYVPDNLSVARASFEKLATLRDSLQLQYGVLLPELSMGMSGDLFEAIAAGSTMIRVGSALWGNRS